MRKCFDEELFNQIEEGMETGVVVKLYSEKMSTVSKSNEKLYHAKAGHRIWMEGEYDLLSKKKLAELKKKYD